MQPRLMKNKHGTYKPVEWGGTNESGLKAIADRVVVLPDTPVTATAGGIMLSDQKLEQLEWGAETGVVVGLGPDAFTWNYERSRRLDVENQVKVGDRILYNMYAGTRHTGLDGKHYLIMRDNDIGALVP